MRFQIKGFRGSGFFSCAKNQLQTDDACNFCLIDELMILPRLFCCVFFSHSTIFSNDDFTVGTNCHVRALLIFTLFLRKFIRILP